MCRLCEIISACRIIRQHRSLKCRRYGSSTELQETTSEDPDDHQNERQYGGCLACIGAFAAFALSSVRPQFNKQSLPSSTSSRCIQPAQTCRHLPLYIAMLSSSERRPNAIISLSLAGPVPLRVFDSHKGTTRPNACRTDLGFLGVPVKRAFS